MKALEEIKKRCEAATPGKWECRWQYGGYVVFDAANRSGIAFDIIERSDAEFFAHARSDNERLVKALELAEWLIRESISMQLCDLVQSDSWASHQGNCRKCAFAINTQTKLDRILKGEGE